MLLDHKFVINNEIYSNPNEFHFDIFSLLNNFQIKEEITVVKGEIVFSENHYFHLVANLRKARFTIPLDFTLEYFVENIKKWIGDKKYTGNLNYFCIKSEAHLDHVVCQEEMIQVSNFQNVEIYREDFIPSNLGSQINFSKGFKNALDTYRVENELDDILLLNNQNFLVGSSFGNVFLIKGTELITPMLSDGAFDNTARERFLTLAKKWPEFDAVSEKTMNPFEITKADEFFILTPYYNIISIKKFRKTDFDDFYAKEIRKKLIQLIQ